MRIVHVTRQFWPGIGGLEAVVDNLTRDQAARGHAVRVVTLDRIFDDPARTLLPTVEKRDGVEIRRICFWGSRRYPLAPAVLQHIRDADIVHVHAIDFFVDFLALASPLHRRKMILSTHGGFFHTPFAARAKLLFFNSVTRLSLRAYRAVAASGVEDGRRFAALAPSRTSTIENGVDIGKFAGLARNGARHILYFGRLAPNKGIDRLIRWFAQLRAASPEWRLTIAGKPMGVTIEDIAAWAAQAAVDDAVAIHDSPDDEALKALIGQADFYACASTFEGFGIAPIEAASAGLHVLLSDIAPFRHIVHRLEGGQIIDFDADAATIAGQSAVLDAMVGQTADYPGLHSFAWPAVAAEFEKLYRTVLANSKRGAP